MKPLNPDAIGHLLQEYVERIPPSFRPMLAPGEDDCGAVSLKGNGFLVATTDYINAAPAMLEFDVGTYADLGALAVSVNLADLLSSGASPLALLLGVTLPHGALESDFKDIFDGAASEGLRWGIPIIGGDTKLGPARAICVTAFGTARAADQLIAHRNASPGDDVWLTGPIGSCAAAIKAFASMPRLPASLQDWAVRSLTRPRLPMREGLAVAELEGRKAGIDVSDGLAVDAQTLARQSAVGIDFKVEDIPVEREVLSIAELVGVDPVHFCFSVGGDLQLLFCTEPRIRAQVDSIGLAHVGTVTDGAGVTLVRGSRRAPLPGIGHTDLGIASFSDEISSILSQLRAQFGVMDSD